MTAVTATTPVELFASLRKAGIQLWREGDQLRYRAAAGTLNAELRQQLLARKSEILELLKNAGEPEPPLQTVPRDGNLPLSFAQQRLWFFDQFEPNNAIYNIAKALRLAGALDVIVLHRCLNENSSSARGVAHLLQDCGRRASAGDPARGVPGDAACRFGGVAKTGAQTGGRPIVRGRGTTSF